MINRVLNSIVDVIQIDVYRGHRCQITGIEFQKVVLGYLTVIARQLCNKQLREEPNNAGNFVIDKISY